MVFCSIMHMHNQVTHKNAKAGYQSLIIAQSCLCDSLEIATAWPDPEFSCSYFSLTNDYSCSILSYPVNDVFLQTSLKKLSFEDALVSAFL